MNLPALSRTLTLLTFAWGSLSGLGHSAIDSQPRNEPWWQDRQKLLNQRAAEAGDKARIIFIGDSITQGWEGEGKEVWAHYYAARNAVNLGIGGDRTQHVLWRLENGNLDGLKPRVAVVMIGTNNSNGEDNTVSQIADGIRAILTTLRQRLPDTQVLLVSIFPRGENPVSQRGKVLMVNQVIRKLADGKNVHWVDFGDRFVAEDGSIPRTLMPDYLHLSPAGYAIWAEAIEDSVCRIIGDARVPVDSSR
jgi:lysophospholipase L1-like esterase